MLVLESIIMLNCIAGNINPSHPFRLFGLKNCDYAHGMNRKGADIHGGNHM